MKPNFLVIGAARSGTTALCGQLVQHPEVFLSSPKEVHFLAHEDRPVTYTGPGDHEMMNRHIISDPAKYLELFSAGASHTARGEGSVSTLYAPGRAVAAIRRWADEDVRLIALLREPASRAHSSYLYLRARGVEPLESFVDALGAEAERREAGFHHMWHYTGMSRYAEQLPAFAEAFGESLLTLVFEEYREDREGHLRRICEHLGIDESFAFDASSSVNRGGEPRSKLVAMAMASLRENERVKNLVKSTTPRSLRERVRQLNLSRPEADQDVMRQLYSSHEPDRRAVYEVLGREVPAWEK